MTAPNYCVALKKDNLVFSAAHFITFNKDVCEQLHGHNYRVQCKVHGPLDENGYVIDFIALRDALMEIIQTLDHRVLLPTKHSMISVEADEREVLVRFEQKRWIFPREDCVLLDIENTTAELLALHIGKALVQRLKARIATNIDRIEVAVDENRGQWAWVELPWSG